jgi:hypothetical protein
MSAWIDCGDDSAGRVSREVRLNLIERLLGLGSRNVAFSTAPEKGPAPSGSGDQRSGSALLASAPAFIQSKKASETRWFRPRSAAEGRARGV